MTLEERTQHLYELACRTACDDGDWGALKDEIRAQLTAARADERRKAVSGFVQWVFENRPIREFNKVNHLWFKWKREQEKQARASAAERERMEER